MSIPQDQGSGATGRAGLQTVLVCLLSLASARLVAAAPAPDGAAHDPSLLASDAELEAARGGFVLDNGMVINISIDKRVYQNGVETFASYFESPQDLALLQGGSPDAGAQFTDSLLNSIIQNAMDNQLIETISNIDIELHPPTALDQQLPGAAIFNQFIEPAFR
ncbi:hypothetical protein [Kineobactrum salinum]|uniref:Uncharacterized protein n=1 Tax=Kineobactrum salinum TaxID=2708301 RepID=A0A6C0TZP7_9GAMM|nr:hypothetical protein [Kineobactrum salinum]QIB65310.1 hypothetical protein G3T16_07755 [Kineobactrum salinum]